jgi:hypothetical protein
MSALAPTRRAMFGAIALAPIVLVAPAVAAKAAPSTAAWDAAFAEYQETIANCERCEWSWESTDIEGAAWRKLMEVPAPHAKALHWKLDYLFGNDMDKDGYCASWRADIVAFTVADAKRLAAT